MPWRLPDGIAAIYLAFDWDATITLVIYQRRGAVTGLFTHLLQEDRVGPLLYAMQQCSTEAERSTMFHNAVKAGQIEVRGSA